MNRKRLYVFIALFGFILLTGCFSNTGISSDELYGSWRTVKKWDRLWSWQYGSVIEGTLWRFESDGSYTKHENYLPDGSGFKGVELLEQGSYTFDKSIITLMPDNGDTQSYKLVYERDSVEGPMAGIKRSRLKFYKIINDGIEDEASITIFR